MNIITIARVFHQICSMKKGLLILLLTIATLVTKAQQPVGIDTVQVKAKSTTTVERQMFDPQPVGLKLEGISTKTWFLQAANDIEARRGKKQGFSQWLIGIYLLLANNNGLIHDKP